MTTQQQSRLTRLWGDQFSPSNSGPTGPFSKRFRAGQASRCSDTPPTWDIVSCPVMTRPFDRSPVQHIVDHCWRIDGPHSYKTFDTQGLSAFAFIFSDARPVHRRPWYSDHCKKYLDILHALRQGQSSPILNRADFRVWVDLRLPCDLHSFYASESLWKSIQKHYTALGDDAHTDYLPVRHVFRWSTHSAKLASWYATQLRMCHGILPRLPSCLLYIIVHYLCEHPVEWLEEQVRTQLEASMLSFFHRLSRRTPVDANVRWDPQPRGHMEVFPQNSPDHPVLRVGIHPAVVEGRG